MAALLACWSAWFWDQPCPSEIINLGAALPQTISGPFLKRLCRAVSVCRVIKLTVIVMKY